MNGSHCGNLIEKTAASLNEEAVMLMLLCHETTARAARPECEFLVTLVRLVSNALVSQGYRHGNLEGFATLPQRKGQRGSVRGEA